MAADRWVDNDVWDDKQVNNRAPRSALHECEPLRPRRRINPFVRAMAYGTLWVAVLWALIVGLFWLVKG